VELTLEHMLRSAKSLDNVDDGLDLYRDIIDEAWESARCVVQQHHILNDKTAPDYFGKHIIELQLIQRTLAIELIARSDQSGSVAKSILHLAGDRDAIMKSYIKTFRGKLFAD